MVVLATTYDPIGIEDMLGRVDANKDPLDRIMDNVNFLYGSHQPPLVNFCGFKAAATTNTYYYPVVPSADGLDYVVETLLYSSANSNDITFSVETSTSNTTGGWTALFSDTQTLNIGDQQKQWTGAMTIAADVRYLRIKCNGVSTVQLHACVIYPKQLTSTSATEKACGFIPYDPTHLAGSGAAIHTEYFNRALANVKAVLADRKQATWTYCNNVERLVTFAASGNIATRLVALSKCHLPGQAGATLTIRYRIAGGGSARLDEDNSSNSIDLTADDTDRTASITIKTDSPTFRLSVDPSSTTTPYYCCIDWAPGD